MLSLIQLLIALVLLGLGAFYYFKTRSSPETPKSEDFDPLEDVKAEPPKPTKTTLVVADEPDIDLEPEVIVTSTKPESEDTVVQPTPTTTPAQPLVPVRQEAYPESSFVIVGRRGKFASEGGHDVNNKTDILSFPPARSVDLHIEHVDVHRGDPQNKNAYIIFKYKNESHKFTFVGNGGLSFKKKDGTFGPNLGVGDASSVVLRDLGLPIDSYKIECLTTTGRNTWYFKPLDLSKELIGVQMTDNADWGGLRGVYFNANS
jgi:hypothetical protein